MSDQPVSAPLLTRRQYLTMRGMRDGVPFSVVAEAVASTALAHPEWDMDEQRTWADWWAVGL